MANELDLDALGARIGIPAQLIPAWKAQVAPTPTPAAAPPPPSAPRFGPGDPGWVVPGAERPSPMPAPSPPPPPGPRPGEQGWDVTRLAPAAPPPMTAPTPPRAPAPSKPMTAQQKYAADLAALQGTNEEIAKLQTNGKQPVLVLQGDVGRRAFDMAKGTEDNIKNAVAANERQKNLEGATFADQPAGGAAMAGIASAGRPFMISPGGRRAHSWAVQEGQQLSDETRSASASADGHQRTAAGLEYMSGQAQAAHELGYLDRLEKAQADHAEEQKRRADQYEEEYNKHLGELDALRQQIREAKIDPFQGTGFAGRIAGALAMGLGAFGSKRGENQGLEAFKQSVGTAIREQELKLDKLDRGAKAESNFIGALRQKYGDVAQAREAAWIAYLEKSKVELGKMLGGSDVRDPQLQAKYERALGAIDGELAHRFERWDQITKDKVVRHDVNAPPTYAGGLDMKHAREDAKYLATEYGKAGIPESLAMLESADRTIDTFGNGDIPGVGPVMGKVPSWMMPDRAVASRQSWNALKNQIGHALFGGALSPQEAEKLSEQLDGANDANSLRRVVQDFRTQLHHKQRNIAAGASAGGKVLYDVQGGSVRPVQLDKPASPYIKEAK